MTLTDVLTALIYGELDQRVIAENQCISPEYLPKVIHCINLGLTALYTRFPLKQKEIYIQLYPEIATYTLDMKYAESNTESNETYKYILDSVEEPFRNDLIRVEAITDEGGNEIALNEYTDPMSIYLPSYNQIQVPLPEYENQLGITYRAKHVTIPTDTLDTDAVEIDLPEYLLEPLLTYVYYKLDIAQNNLNGSNEGVSHYGRFDAMCRSVELNGLMPTEGTQMDKLDRRGYV